MPEIKRVVVPVEVSYVCDACGTGMMEAISSMDRATGECEHQCLICEHKDSFKWKQYPRIEHVGEDESI